MSTYSNSPVITSVLPPPNRIAEVVAPPSSSMQGAMELMQAAKTSLIKSNNQLLEELAHLNQSRASTAKNALNNTVHEAYKEFTCARQPTPWTAYPWRQVDVNAAIATKSYVPEKTCVVDPTRDDESSNTWTTAPVRGVVPQNQVPGAGGPLPLGTVFPVSISTSLLHGANSSPQALRWSTRQAPRGLETPPSLKQTVVAKQAWLSFGSAMWPGSLPL